MKGRFCGRCPAFPKRYVESVESQRVPVAPGAQGQTPKKVPETDAIFANIRERDRDSQDEAVMRLSMDCKATVKIGDYSRGGKTRGDHRAADHDKGCEEKHTPFGVVNYPPYHSKYNPVERCWGILEKHWNGAKLTDTQTMLEWAKTMTWKGVHPVVELSRTVYEKGVTVAKEAMQAVESRLERNPLLPKWDI
ncbi:MAG: hypothetical protein ABTS22_14200, partial [Accumulibacter sp.]